MTVGERDAGVLCDLELSRLIVERYRQGLRVDVRFERVNRLVSEGREPGSPAELGQGVSGAPAEGGPK